MDEIEGAFFPVHRTFETLNGDVTARPSCLVERRSENCRGNTVDSARVAFLHGADRHWQGGSNFVSLAQACWFEILSRKSG